MKHIPLTKGKVALVDDQDYKYLMQWTWYAARNGKYAARTTQWPTRRMVYMHHEVAKRMRWTSKRIDHRNRNSLDNRRQNLRPTTQHGNIANAGMRSNNTSGFKGVSWYKDYSLWRAYIGVKGRFVHLGYFKSRIRAAHEYNAAARAYFGDFACLNKIPAGKRHKNMKRNTGEIALV